MSFEHVSTNSMIWVWSRMKTYPTYPKFNLSLDIPMGMARGTVACGVMVVYLFILGCFEQPGQGQPVKGVCPVSQTWGRFYKTWDAGLWLEKHLQKRLSFWGHVQESQFLFMWLWEHPCQKEFAHICTDFIKVGQWRRWLYIFHVNPWQDLLEKDSPMELAEKRCSTSHTVFLRKYICVSWLYKFQQVATFGSVQKIS